jgi:hypothetical protein
VIALRVIGRFVGYATAVLLVSHALAGASQGQPVDKGNRYLAAVGTYPSDPEAGVRALIELRDADIEDGVHACLAVLERARHTLRCTPQDLMTAAMLQADAAALIIAIDHERAAAHIRTGSRLLRPLQVAPHRLPPAATGTEATFIPLWYAHTARLFLVQRHFPAALSIVREGLATYPRSAELHLALGVVYEVPWFWFDGNPRGERIDRTNPASGRVAGPFSGPEERVRYSLAAAANQYRRALSFDAAHGRARLRLGWLHVLAGDRRASEDLAAALRDASDDDERYLAHLMLGGLAERAGNRPEAIAAYSRAREAGPSYKTACIGLSHAYAVSGETASAADEANRCLMLQPDPERPDPWLTLRLGVTDTPVLESLHEQARRR